MKILLLGFPQGDGKATGGQIVDVAYKRMIGEDSRIELTDMTYDSLGIKKSWISNREINEISQVLNKYDAVLFDARNFTRFITKMKRLKKQLSCKIYGVLHHFYFMQYTGWKKSVIKMLEIRTLSFLDGILYSGIYPFELSKDIKKLKKIPLTYLGIGFEKEQLVNRVGKSNHSIVFIGHIIHRKGVHLLIKVLEKIKKDTGVCPSAMIIGDDKRDLGYTAKLHAMIEAAELSETVKMAGRVSDKDKEAIVRNSGLFVFPSLCEGYGMVVLETMRYGIPAVVFDNTNLPYIVHDGIDGFIVKNGDWMQMAEKVKDILSDSRLYERLSQGARTSYENVMTWEDVKCNITEWISQIVP